MPILQLPTVRTVPEYFAFAGGLDQTTPAIRVPAGRLFTCLNYEPVIDGGYRRIGGYERTDGRARPSDAVYQAVGCTLTTTPAAGASLIIGAATCWFVEAITGGMVVTNVTGTIPASTAIMDGVTNRGTTGATTNIGTSISALQDATYLADASDIYRALITAPTGSGAIRGVAYYSGNLYCFRDNAGATACNMWKATTGGWTQVVFGEQVAFSNANTNVGVGDTLTQGGVTAVIAYVVLETGTLASGVNTGRLIITGRAGGNFAAGAATSTGAGAVTLSGAQTAVALSAGGSYQFDVGTFGGQQASQKLFGANGLDRCFQFDGANLVPLNTTAAVDTPAYVKVHRNYLYVAIGSSAFNSSVGDPTRFVASEGALENPVSNTITAFASLPGQALGIFSRNSSHVLTGASATTWAMSILRADVGAVVGSVVTMGDTFVLDDRGIMGVATSQQYGNFAAETLSRRVQATIDALRNKVVCAYAVRGRNLYTLLCNDGTGVVMALSTGGVVGFTTIQLGFTPTCAWSSNDSSGNERVWVGGSDGKVYEMNRGSSFDGSTIEAYAKIFFNHAGSPRMRKRYRLCVLEMQADNYATMQFMPDFSYGDPDLTAHLAEPFEQISTGGIWNLVNWNSFTWSTMSVAQPRLPIEGTGTNIALFFYSKTRLDTGHVLQGANVHYSPRRLQR